MTEMTLARSIAILGVALVVFAMILNWWPR